ncbi:FadR family transcriptional regulator [Fusobacterium simiae]|uniref:FadR family transcriptional regulator n=1 Tax=Fusobacterium simiae TaxID=855 RepID=A0ABT4DJ50_FUSSI|nr:FadR/GntR family transcriptional regulator [Fusobacterium simiae]MCY7008640.1 FadR family transcriptional regulator [Fusobacterium simiae]
MIQKITSMKLYEQVVQQIKSMVLNGTYKKGDLLPSEKELIEMTGVSRITIREGLKILAEMGIIETKKGKGSIVLINGKELIFQSEGEEGYLNFRKNFELSTNTRLLLEPEIARQASLKATEEDIEKMEMYLLHENKKLNVDQIQGINLEMFHQSILSVLKNPLLSDFFNTLTKLEADTNYTILIPPSRQTSVYNELNNQHYKILQAIKKHNEEFAYFYMKEHLIYLKDTYTKYFNDFYK